MTTISVLSRKGGCGKTLVSHLISAGLAARGYPVMMIQTDVRAKVPPEETDGREYFLRSISSRDANPERKFIDLYEKAQRFSSIVTVVDGGANRRNVDFAAGLLSDLVLIPTGFSSEDLEVALADYEEMNAWLTKNDKGHIPVLILLNRWPGEQRRLETVLRRPFVEEFLERTQSTRLPFIIPELTSVIDITFHGQPTAAVPVRRAMDALVSDIIQATDMPQPPTTDSLPEEAKAPKAA